MIEKGNEEAIALMNRLIGYEIIQKYIRDQLKEKHNILVGRVHVEDNGGEIEIEHGIENFGIHETEMNHSKTGFVLNKFRIYTQGSDKAGENK